MRPIIAVLAGLVLGIVLAVLVMLAVRPECPTEDACRADYHDGRWTITETVP